MRGAGLKGYFRPKCGRELDGIGKTLQMAQYDTPRCKDYTCEIDTPEG